MSFQAPHPSAFQQRIQSRVVEARGLGLYDSMAVVVPMMARLSTTVLRGSSQFICKTNKKFRLQRVIPIVNIVVPSNESITNAGATIYNAAGPTTVFTGGDAFDRIYAKAHNCVFDLKAASQKYQANANASFRLSDLMQPNGGPGAFFDCPTTFPEDTSFDLFLSLQDSAAAGSLTEYGLLLVGSYIRL